MKEKVLEVIKSINFDKEFFTDIKKKRKYSYDDFFEECCFISKYIETFDNYKNIIVILENSKILAEMYFAIMLTDWQIWAIDPQKSLNEIVEIMDEIPEAVLITDREDIITKRHLNISEEFLVEIEKSREELNVKNIVLTKLNERDFSKEYLVTFTSGTSGQAKGVSHSLNNLFETAYALQEKVEAKEGEVFLHVMPMTYMAGILNSLIFPFIAKLRIALSERFSVRTALGFWSSVVKYQATVFWLSPTMLLMIEQTDRKTIGQQFCKENEMLFLIGTAPLSDNIRFRFEQKYGVSLYASYGLSETLFVSVETKESKKICKERNVGEILNNVKVEIGFDGEIKLNIPWMFLGYTNVEEKDFFEDKYYNTGDLGEITNNILKITGRKKDLIIKGGMNLSPTRVENILNELSEVEEKVVFGAENVYGEEVVCCAYTISSNYRTIDINTLQKKMEKLVDGQLGKMYHIDMFLYCQEIPKNINGKVDKQKLKEKVKEVNDIKN